MNRKNTTRNALFTSIISLLLCVSMLVGTTFAWFTDEVQSGLNTINAGNLDIELLANGNPVDSSTMLFDLKDANDNPTWWEPGMVVYENLQIQNVGSLALKYRMTLNIGEENDLNGHKLSEVLKIAILDEKIEAGADRQKILEKAKAAAEADQGKGALSNFYVTGELEAKTNSTERAVVIFWAPNSAEIDNLYNANNGQVTSDLEPLHIKFGINLQATQQMSEQDSFGKDYDDFASILPKATVNDVSADYPTVAATLGIGGTAEDVPMDFVLQFLPNETLDEAKTSDYIYYNMDFVIKADKDVPAESVALAGFYSAWCDLINGGNWVALTSPVDIAAGEEIRLVDSMAGGFKVSYKDICQYAIRPENSINGFLCGATDLTGENAGTTITVELRAYETTSDPHDSSNSGVEVGPDAYEVVGTYSYTFGGSYITLDDGSVLFNEYDGGTSLASVKDVTAADYTVPENVDTLANGIFAGNPNITSVTVPASATDFGATGVSDVNASGGAFKGSAVKSVTLEEGMTEIPAAAFNGAKQLNSVNIPSTVETIGVNALRQTALTELTIPATVTTVKTGAFRDISALTTVTVEGNTSFANYAFRSCPNLTDIYLLGDDVTISGSQFACHSDNGDATGITIYVKNATVAARVYAAQTSAYGYEVKILGQETDGSDASEAPLVKNDTQLADAISAGADTVILGSGTYTIPDSAQGKTMTIVGNGDTAVSVVDDGSSEGDIDYSFDGSTVTFENVTLNIQGGDHPGYARMSATYNNCTIVGSNYCLYGDSVFNNCTFNLNNGYVWTWGAANVEFNGCTFEDTVGGMAKAILVHNTVETTVTVKDCTFIATTEAATWDGIHVAAVSIDPENGSPDATVYFEGTNTFSDVFYGLYQVKYADEVDDVTVYVDGTKVENITAMK